MKREETCESVLVKYLQENPVWHKKVHLYAVAEDWSPETVGRTLRDMTHPPDGSKPKAFVDYYKGRFKQDLAMYSIAPKEPVKKVRYEIIERDGKRVAVQVYE